MAAPSRARHLVIVLGDQLDLGSPAFAGFDADRDVVLMMEVAEESTHVPSHKQRTVLFLSAMRHFAAHLRKRRGWRVRYVELDDRQNTQTFDGEVTRAVHEERPERILIVRPGEWRVLQMVESWTEALAVEVELLEDGHFFLEPDEFAEWVEGRKELLLEHFYRMMRKRLGVLVDADGRPEGDQWNYDKDNRERFDGRRDDIPPPLRFDPDAMTRRVMELVERRFPDAPGSLASFGWPVTRRQARAALRDFVQRRLPRFGTYQDAMVTGEPWMYHALLSAPLNLKLLDPRECVDLAVEAYRSGEAPINAVEGFVRQLIGWREFIRGVYWHQGPGYGDRNALGQHGELPELYWHGETDMACLKQCVGEVLEHGFGHHIQRLMITGNFALVAGVHPRKLSNWYLAMYVDAVDWVTLPNTLGMAMYADGGVVGTKPYAASGRYVDRMSDYCKGCRYDPTRRTGDDACPFSTFYWDFLARTQGDLGNNRRMGFAYKNLERLDDDELSEIRSRARSLRSELGIGAIRA